MVLDLISMQHVEGFQTLLQIRYKEITKQWNHGVIRFSSRTNWHNRGDQGFSFGWGLDNPGWGRQQTILPKFLKNCMGWEIVRTPPRSATAQEPRSQLLLKWFVSIICIVFLSYQILQCTTKCSFNFNIGYYPCCSYYLNPFILIYFHWCILLFDLKFYYKIQAVWDFPGEIDLDIYATAFLCSGIVTEIEIMLVTKLDVVFLQMVILTSKYIDDNYQHFNNG